MKLFNQVKRSEWREDEYSMPVIARFGTGGGNVPVVLESNQNHARAEDTEICPCLPASMGLGGYVPMIVFEKHFGNEIRIHDDICPTLGERLGTGGGQLPDDT